MANYVDFQHLKATISIEQVLDMLGIKHLKPHGQALREGCPICQIGNDRTFVVTLAKNSYYCFSEKIGGDIIELTARFYRTSQKEAAQRIAQHFGQTGTAAALPESLPTRHRLPRPLGSIPRRIRHRSTPHTRHSRIAACRSKPSVTLTEANARGASTEAVWCCPSMMGEALSSLSWGWH